LKVEGHGFIVCEILSENFRRISRRDLISQFFVLNLLKLIEENKQVEFSFQKVKRANFRDLILYFFCLDLRNLK
jgi:hypothetical protein